MTRPAALCALLAAAGAASCVGTLGEGKADDHATGGDADSDADTDADSDADADGDADTDADGDGDTDADADADPCLAIPGAAYGSLPINGLPSDRPPAEHADLNLPMRGWETVDEVRGLVDVDGPTDDGAPLLSSLFADDRVPGFSTVYAVRDWNWGVNGPGGLISDPPVTLAGMQTEPGEVIETPRSGYDIGQGNTALVLYATERTLTLKYTGEDDVVRGYTIHVVGVCTDPTLLALYRRLDAEGRGSLPAVPGDAPLGRAIGDEIQVAIRDTGSFMDPRVRKDWWSPSPPR